MPTIMVAIKDDNGCIIGTQEIEVDLGSGSFHDVEGAIEAFQKQALPKATQQILTAQQRKLRAQKKGS